MFSCEYCEILRTTFFTEHLQWLLLTKWTKCNGYWKASLRLSNFEIIMFKSLGVIYLLRTWNFRKTDISYPQIRTCRCAYQGVRNVRFCWIFFAYAYTKCTVPYAIVVKSIIYVMCIFHFFIPFFCSCTKVTLLLWLWKLCYLFYESNLTL